MEHDRLLSESVNRKKCSLNQYIGNDYRGKCFRRREGLNQWLRYNVSICEISGHGQYVREVNTKTTKEEKTVFQGGNIIWYMQCRQTVWQWMEERRGYYKQ